MSRMEKVYSMRTTASLQNLLYRVSCALAYIPGVQCAAPPYDAPSTALIGNGVTLHDDHGVVVFTCYVVFNPAVSRQLPEQCLLVQSVIHAVIGREYTQDFRIDVVVTAIDIKGTHASHRTD
jgi:hypothetical protein